MGIFGVMSYAVSRRTQEMAIRMALGASRTDVLRLVLGEGLIVTMFGVVLGLVTALAVSPRDGWLCIRHQGDGPDHLCGGGLLLIGVSLAACYLPARRATRVDPTMALRYE